MVKKWKIINNKYWKDILQMRNIAVALTLQIPQTFSNMLTAHAEKL